MLANTTPHRDALQEGRGGGAMGRGCNFYPTHVGNDGSMRNVTMPPPLLCILDRNRFCVCVRVSSCFASCLLYTYLYMRHTANDFCV
jgi:hypothetical protein